MKTLPKFSQLRAMVQWQVRYPARHRLRASSNSYRGTAAKVRIKIWWAGGQGWPDSQAIFINFFPCDLEDVFPCDLEEQRWMVLIEYDSRLELDQRKMTIEVLGLGDR